jgi:tetratricopeptide (TPR) repeat protein
MAGAVTGINDQKIFCSINGAHSEQKGRIGKPVSLVVREVLQDAESLDDAVRIIRESQVFVTDGYLIADGKTGEAVVVEKSPGRTEVRRIENDQLLQANHFEAAGFKDDAGNSEHFREGTTASRRARLEELVSGRDEALTPEGVARILRDVRGSGNVEWALGNRGSINAMIATHAVVADVTQGILWVSRGPHQLGQFDAYSIQTFGGSPPAPPIPADPLLSSGAYERLCKARALIQQASDSEVPDEALLREALELNPRDPKALCLLGEALAAKGRPGEARVHFEAALAASPPFKADREAINTALAGLE